MPSGQLFPAGWSSFRSAMSFPWAELDEPESATLGPLLRDVTRALQTVLGCTKTYVALFAESKGFAHLHFHVLPRMAEWTDDELGPGAILKFGSGAGHRVAENTMDSLALLARGRPGIPRPASARADNKVQARPLRDASRNPPRPCRPGTATGSHSSGLCGR
jgi:diadenosine tetraphosphate (Ap4A) HIT family hydrolase